MSKRDWLGNLAVATSPAKDRASRMGTGALAGGRLDPSMKFWFEPRSRQCAESRAPVRH